MNDFERYVYDYSRGGICVISPDAPEAWADGFRDAHCHVLNHQRNHVGTWLDSMVLDYRDGYLCGVEAIVSAERS